MAGDHRKAAGETMKVGIDSYCYHRWFGEIYPDQQDPGTRWGFEDLLNRAVQLGVGGVSLETCFLRSLQPDYLSEVKAALDEHGLERVLAWGHPDGLEAGRNHSAWKDLNALIPNVPHLGTRILRIVASSLRFRDEPPEPQIKEIAKMLKESAGIAAGHDVVLALENHIDFTSVQILEILDRVSSDHLRVTFDTGNALRLMEDPVEAAKRLGPYVVATHIKDLDACRHVSPKAWHFFSCVPLGTGLIDLPGVVRALKVAGYAGLLAVEVDHPKDGQDEDAVVALGVAYLKDVIGRTD